MMLYLSVYCVKTAKLIIEMLSSPNNPITANLNGLTSNGGGVNTDGYEICADFGQ